MAMARDACGLGELSLGGNGRRLHLGIPEAVFVVRDVSVLGILVLGRDPFLPGAHPGLDCAWGGAGAEGVALRDLGERAASPLALPPSRD